LVPNDGSSILRHSLRFEDLRGAKERDSDEPQLLLSVEYRLHPILKTATAPHGEACGAYCYS
jgi:hypothetical protein